MNVIFEFCGSGLSKNYSKIENNFFEAIANGGN